MNAFLSVIVSDGKYIDLDFVEVDTESVESLFARMFENTIGLSYLLLSILLVLKVDERVNIIEELKMIFIFDFIIISIKNVYMVSSPSPEESNLCISSVPVLYILNSIKLI
jgi:hypothetical protein